MAGYEMFTVNAGPPEEYVRPEMQGPPMPRFGSWRQIRVDYATKLMFFAAMHQAASDARRSPDRDYGWVDYEHGRGWIVRRKGPLPQDRRR